MTTSLLQNKLPTCPTAPEENWRRTNPDIFFLPQDEILNFQGHSAQENKNKLNPWKICFRQAEHLPNMLKKLEPLCGADTLEVLRSNSHRLVVIDINNGLADVCQSENLKSYLEFKSAPWQPESIVKNSAIGAALSARLHNSSPHKITLTLSTQNNEVPLVVVLNHLAPHFSQSYGHFHFILSENTKCDLLLIDGGSPFSLFRHHLELGKNAQLTQVWLNSPQSTIKSMYLERLVTLSDNAKFKDAQAFVPQGQLRINSHIDHCGVKSVSENAGVVLASSGKFDYEPIQEHRASLSKSSLSLKMILDKKAQATFQGLIYAHKGIQKCEALQENKNILISKLARVNASPRLEILPHDIVCKHGSATAEIDKKQLYYLQSRGFEEKQAQHLILTSFAHSALRLLEEESALQQIAQGIFSLSLSHAAL